MCSRTIAIAGILAVVVITYAGIEYMVSEAVSSKEAAKKRIWSALSGLLLAFLSYLILYTLNPDLVTNLNLGIPNTPVTTLPDPNPPPPPIQRKQEYLLRSVNLGCEDRPNMTLINSNSTPGALCSQNAGGVRVGPEQVCCHWSGSTPVSP